MVLEMERRNGNLDFSPKPTCQHVTAHMNPVPLQEPFQSVGPTTETFMRLLIIKPNEYLIFTSPSKSETFRGAQTGKEVVNGHHYPLAINT